MGATPFLPGVLTQMVANIESTETPGVSGMVRFGHISDLAGGKTPAQSH